MKNWVYHPFQTPKIVEDEELTAYLETGWFKSYGDIDGYTPNEHGVNTNDSDEYFLLHSKQEEKAEVPEIKKRGRPPRAKHGEGNQLYV